MRRRVLGALLALCLLAGLLPGAALAWEREDGLPEGAELLEESPPLPEAGGAAGQTDYLVRSLRLEAGQRTAEIDVTARTACTLWAALYGGDGRLLDAAASRAQAGDSTVRVSFSVRAPEGFTARAFLLDKDGRPLCESRRAGTYSIDSLRLEDGMIRAGVTAAGSCTLRVRFRGEEGGSTLEEAALPVSGSPEQEAVEAEMPEGLPQYFLLEAQLVDGASKALCGLYTDRTHTRAYQASVSKTPQDYPAERVLDFGDSGFAVLPQGTRRAGEAQETAGGYTVPAMPALPSPGEVVALDVDGATVPVKVKSASSRDGKTVIVPDENASLADLYDSLRVDATVELGSAGQTARAGGGGGSHEPHVNLNATFPVNRNVTLVSTGTMCLKVHTYFDKAADPEYVEQSKLLIGEGTLSLISEGELSTEMIKDALALEIAETPTLPLGTTGLGATIKVSLPLAFNITPQSRIDAHYTLYMGDTYRAGAGFQKVDESSFEIDRPNLKTAVKSVSASLGLQGSLTLGGVVPTIPLEASLDYQVGGRFASEQDLDKESGTVKHACQFCCRERVSVFQELGASFSCDLGKINIPLAKLTVPLVEKNLVQGYHSYRNDPDSPLKGRNTLGSGECPNKQYLVSVSARDTAGNPVSGMEAAAANQATGKTVTGTIPCSLWLYANQHIISAEIGGRTCKLYFTPSAENRTAELRPQPVTLITWVRDRAKGSYLKGASVTVTDISDPDHPRETGRGTTDDRGYFDLRLLPGVYRVAASMEDYQDASQTVAITGGAPDPVELALERERAYAALTVSVIDGEGNPVSAYVTFKSDEYTTMTATGAAGTVTQKFLPPGTYTVSVPATGGYPAASRTVTLEPGEEGSVTITMGEKDPEPKPCTVSGIVTDSGGTPLSGASVTAKKAGSTSDSIQAKTASDGSYSLTLPAGEWTLSASASGYEAETAALTAEEGGSLTRDFALEKVLVPGDLWVYLDHSSDSRLIGATVNIWSGNRLIASSSELEWSYSPRMYYVRMEDLPEGEVAVEVFSRGFQPVERFTQTIVPNKTVSTTVELVPNEIQYRLEGDTLYIDGTGDMPNYTMQGDYPYAQESRGVTRVVVGSGITGIGDYAFSNTYMDKVTSVSLPEKLTRIGRQAFSGSSLSSIQIPAGVTEIGESAFSGCWELEQVRLPDGLTVLGDGAFGNCKTLKAAQLPGSLKQIPKEAFRNCALESLDIPEGVTGIGEYAFFSNPQLTALSLPESLLSLGKQSFAVCSSLTAVRLPSSLRTFGESAFAGCTALVSVNLPEGLTQIGNSMFEKCTALTRMEFPSTLATIAPKTCYECCNLETIVIPEGIEAIGYDAFSGCTKLQALALPSTLTTLGDGAFYQCLGLTEVTIPGSVRIYSAYNSERPNLYTGCFGGCINLTSAVMEDGPDHIGPLMFSGCQNLTFVRLPSTLTRLAARSFSGCKMLSSLDIPDSVRHIEEYAFAYCTFTAIDIPDGVTYIGNYAFGGNSSLTELTLPDGLIHLGKEAFRSCSNLARMTVPEGVGEIKDGTFEWCTGLEFIHLPSALASIGGSAFYGCEKLTSIDIPDSVEYIGEKAFQQCSFTSLKLPENLKAIYSYALYNCGPVEWIYMPAGVERIHYQLLGYVPKLYYPKHIYFGGTQEEWDAAVKRCGYSQPFFDGNIDDLQWHFNAAPPTGVSQAANEAPPAEEAPPPAEQVQT